MPGVELINAESALHCGRLDLHAESLAAHCVKIRKGDEVVIPNVLAALGLEGLDDLAA